MPIDSISAPPRKKGGRPKGSGPTPSSFKPGVSGNPGGRVKRIAELTALCQEHGTEIFERVLAAALGNGPDWFESAKLLLAYGFGHPTAKVSLDPEGATPVLNIFTGCAPPPEVAELAPQFVGPTTTTTG